MYKPFTCGMIADPKCSSVIGIWSLGISGECSHNQSGFRIGIHGFRKGAIQVSYTIRRNNVPFSELVAVVYKQCHI